MVSRFLQGAFASTGSAMVGGTIADMWDTGERGHPMALFSFAVIGTCGIAPAVAGIIEQNLGWRWIQWIGMIFSGVFFIWLFVFGAPETRVRVTRFEGTAFPQRSCFLSYRYHFTRSKSQETAESHGGPAISHRRRSSEPSAACLDIDHEATLSFVHGANRR